MYDSVHCQLMESIVKDGVWLIYFLDKAIYLEFQLHDLSSCFPDPFFYVYIGYKLLIVSYTFTFISQHLTLLVQFYWNHTIVGIMFVYRVMIAYWMIASTILSALAVHYPRFLSLPNYIGTFEYFILWLFNTKCNDTFNWWYY